MEEVRGPRDNGSQNGGTKPTKKTDGSPERLSQFDAGVEFRARERGSVLFVYSVAPFVKSVASRASVTSDSVTSLALAPSLAA
jgi:hypothetical protein